jgi:hypothetical protein
MISQLRVLGNIIHQIPPFYYFCTTASIILERSWLWRVVDNRKMSRAIAVIRSMPSRQPEWMLMDLVRCTFSLIVGWLQKLLSIGLVGCCCYGRSNVLASVGSVFDRRVWIQLSTSSRHADSFRNASTTLVTHWLKDAWT